MPGGFKSRKSILAKKKAERRWTASSAAADAASSNAEPEPDLLLRADDGASACAPWQSHDPSSARLASFLPLVCFAPVPFRVVLLIYPSLQPDVDVGAAAVSTLPSAAEGKALDRQKRCEFNRVGPSSIPRAAGRFHPSAYPPSRQTWLSTLMCVLRVALRLLSSLCFQLTNSPRVPILQMTTSTFSSTYGRMSTTRRPNVS